MPSMICEMETIEFLLKSKAFHSTDEELITIIFPQYLLC